MMLTGRFFIISIITLCAVLSVSLNTYAESCTALSKSTKYILKKYDKVSDILQKFKVEPVFGEGGSLDKILKQQNVTDEEQIEEGTEISIPFECEEHTQFWKLIDRGGDRLILNEKADHLKSGQIAAQTAIQIINNDGSNQPDQTVTSDDQQGEVSEALRYRMICEGEWTGTECVTRYSTLFVLGGGWYNRYDGTDATTGAGGVLLSRLNPELGFGWTNYWTENFRTTLSLSLINNEIHPEVRERPIDQNKKLLNSLTAEVKYEIGPYGFIFSINQTEKIFYRFYQQNILLNEDGGVVVNAVPIMIFRGGLSYMLHQAGKYRFDVELGYSLLQGGQTSGYSVATGSATDLLLTVQHDRVKEYIFGALKYEMSQQNTDILLQKAQELGIKFGYAWKLKDW